MKFWTFWIVDGWEPPLEASAWGIRATYYYYCCRSRLRLPIAMYYTSSFTSALDKKKQMAVTNIFFVLNSWMNQAYDLGAGGSVCRGGGADGAATMGGWCSVCVCHRY